MFTIVAVLRGRIDAERLLILCSVSSMAERTTYNRLMMVQSHHGVPNGNNNHVVLQNYKMLHEMRNSETSINTKMLLKKPTMGLCNSLNTE